MNDNTENAIDRIKKDIERLYQAILAHPQIYCHETSIESYILAFEHILDLLSGSDRHDSYALFLAEKQFGMHFFATKFARDNHYVLGFIALSKISDENTSVLSEYVEQFLMHWAEFLKWRQRT
jgi:hypothetical protein